MAGSEKGNVSTDIGQDVIQEALRSVEKRTGAPEDAAVELDPAAADDAEPPAAVPTGDPLQKELDGLKAQLEFSQAKGRELMEKIKEEHERKLRAVADLENYRKRAVKEKEEVQRFGVEKLLKDFLPVVDNLDRALEHAQSPADFDSVVKGVRMTRKMFEDALAKHGVKSFSAVGQPFDPRLHEAMQQAVRDDMPPNHVAAEVLRGYTLNERLVRPALVVVTKASEGGGPGTESKGGEGPDTAS